MLRDFFLAFGTAFIGGLLFSPSVAQLGRKMGAVDFPEAGRRIHTSQTPRTGGLVILVAFMLGTLLLLGSASFSKFLIAGKVHQLRTLFLGISMVIAIGAYDDFFGTSALKKLIPEIFLGALVYSGGLRIENLVLPYGYHISFGQFSIVVTILWVVVIMNAINLIDGMDGLCVGISILVLTSFAFLAFMRGLYLEGALTSVMIMATSGFFWYNVTPARIFLGDSGSLLLGFSIAAFSMWIAQTRDEGFLAVLPMACLVVPIFDTALAVLRRTLRGTSIFMPDIEHIHHRLLKLGLCVSHVVHLLLSVTALGCILGFAIVFGGVTTARVGAVSLALLVAFLLVLYLVGARKGTLQPSA